MAPKDLVFKTISEQLTTFRSSERKFDLLSLPGNGIPDAVTRARRLDVSTLFILDSSFNPPSRAHALMVEAALAGEHLTNRSASDYPKPHGVLLLFASQNADKSASPASFEHRLSMMTCLARDLQDEISHQNSNTTKDNVQVNVGMTTLPYYVGKSDAIASSQSYSDDTRHVHLIGFDTVVRLLNPKYYRDFSPPLAALQPYFGKGHRFLVALRPENAPGQNDERDLHTVEQQSTWLKELGKGSLADVGFKSQWASQIEVLRSAKLADGGEGVSSTKIREAIENGNTTAISSFCTPSVTEWIRTQSPYS